MIAISHYGAHGDISGVTTWLRLLLEELRSSGVPYSLNLHHFGDHPEDGSLYQAEAAEGIVAKAFPRSNDTVKDVRRTLEFLNETRARLFIPQCLPSVHYAASIATNYGLPWIFTIHSDDPTYWALADACGPDARDGIWVSVSERIAEEARANFPRADVRVIPYGVRVPVAKADWNHTRFRVVYLGRVVEEQKRISKVIEVLIRACMDSSFMEAVVVGEGPQRVEMEARVGEAQLEGRIRFTGRLEKDEVAEELRAAQAILLMSDYEGLPVALLEAMATGVVPVVRSIRSGVPEIVRNGQTGYLVEDDVCAVAACLVKLSTSQQEWQQVSDEARELVASRYSNEASLEKWLAVIHELGARAAPRYPIMTKGALTLPASDPRLAHLDPRPEPAVAGRRTLPRRVCGKLLRFVKRVITR